MSERITQEEQILAHLKSGKRITPLEALNLYKCFRLGGRIFSLRKLGHNIETKMIPIEKGKRIAEYRLVS